MNKIKKIEKLIEELNLIYYEYDTEKHKLVLDKKWSKDYIYSEFMKITYMLTSNNIVFFIDEKKSIVVADKDSLLKKTERYTKSIINYVRNSIMNIYILSDKQVKWAKNLPVFEVKYIQSKLNLASYDALIFTSKNAIKAINSFDKSWKNKPSYVIAPQTAKVLKDLGGNLKFVGKEKHGNAFAQELIKEFENKKILYIRGSKVVSDLLNIINNSQTLICDELIVYETVCKKFDKDVKLPKNSTIIFSSPSTIDCFFKNLSWDDSFTAISIGNTTAQYFPKNITPIIADTTSLDSCVKKAIESF